MYCRKCGKQIDYDAEMCVECQENEELFVPVNETPAAAPVETPVQQPVYEPVQPTQPQQPVQPMTYAQPVQNVPQKKGSRMTGFGLALAALIVSEFGLGFFYGILLGLSEALDGYDSATMYVEIDPSLYVLYILGLGMSIFSLVAGIKSMRTFFRCKRNGEVTPIVTLILGIGALVMAALALLIGFIALMAIIAV